MSLFKRAKAGPRAPTETLQPTAAARAPESSIGSIATKAGNGQGLSSLPEAHIAQQRRPNNRDGNASSCQQHEIPGSAVMAPSEPSPGEQPAVLSPECPMNEQLAPSPPVACDSNALRRNQQGGASTSLVVNASSAAADGAVQAPAGMLGPSPAQSSITAQDGPRKRVRVCLPAFSAVRQGQEAKHAPCDKDPPPSVTRAPAGPSSHMLCNDEPLDIRRIEDDHLATRPGDGWSDVPEDHADAAMPTSLRSSPVIRQQSPTPCKPVSSRRGLLDCKAEAQPSSPAHERGTTPDERLHTASMGPTCAQQPGLEGEQSNIESGDMNGMVLSDGFREEQEDPRLATHPVEEVDLGGVNLAEQRQIMREIWVRNSCGVSAANGSPTLGSPKCSKRPVARSSRGKQLSIAAMLGTRRT